MTGPPIADSAAAAEPILARRQRGVAAAMLAGVAATTAIFAFGARPLPYGRELVWAVASLGPLFCLFVSVAALANRRFFSAPDIDAAAGGPPSAMARILQAIIQNTLEQAVLALGVYAILALLLPQASLSLPWALSGGFVVGRLLFALGYRAGAAGRAFGFGLTLYPTVAALLYAAWLTLGSLSAG
jgi:hypothetical protein